MEGQSLTILVTRRSELPTLKTTLSLFERPKRDELTEGVFCNLKILLKSQSLAAADRIRRIHSL